MVIPITFRIFVSCTLIITEENDEIALYIIYRYGSGGRSLCPDHLE